MTAKEFVHLEDVRKYSHNLSQNWEFLLCGWPLRGSGVVLKWQDEERFSKADCPICERKRLEGVSYK